MPLIDDDDPFDPEVNDEERQFLFSEFVFGTQDQIEYESSSEERLILSSDFGNDFLTDIAEEGHRHSSSTKETENVDLIVPKGLIEYSQTIREFLKSYYSFLNENPVSSSSIINDILVSKCRNIDKETDEGITKIFYELSNEFTNRKDLYFDRRVFLKNVTDFYSHKGNPEFFRILIFLLLGDFSTKIDEPWYNVLHTSIGKWRQERYFSLEITEQVSTFLSEKDIHYVTLIVDEFGNRLKDLRTQVDIEVSRVERDSEHSFRIYTFSPDFIPFIAEGQIYEIRSIPSSHSLDEGIFFESKLVPTISKIEIVQGGKFWQRGKILSLESDDNPSSLFQKPTLVQIDRISNNNNTFGLEEISEIRSVKILDPGYGHIDGETFTFFPFPIPPSAKGVFILHEKDPNFPFGTNHTINLSDDKVGTHDSVIGFGKGNYFLKNYEAEIYTQSTVLYTKTNSSLPSSGDLLTSSSKNNNTNMDDDPFYQGITLQDWEKSLAKIKVVFDVYGSLPGSFDSERSSLSNGNIRLQDNFYYQLYSYVFQCEANPNEYDDILKKYHPAGLKGFFDYNNTISSGIQIDLESYVSFICTYHDTADSDAIIRDKHVIKERFDTSSVSSRITDKHFEKTLFDSAFPMDVIHNCWGYQEYEEENYSACSRFISSGKALILTKTINDYLSETNDNDMVFFVNKERATTVDVTQSQEFLTNKDTIKVRNDSASASDSIEIIVRKSFSNDTITVIHQPAAALIPDPDTYTLDDWTDLSGPIDYHSHDQLLSFPTS